MNCIQRRKFTVAEQKAVDREINRQLAEYIRKHEKNIDAAMLWALHEFPKTKFGAARLREFYEFFQPVLAGLLEYYEMSTEDQCWLCDMKLKQIGVDLDEWRREVPLFKGKLDGRKPREDT